MVGRACWGKSELEDRGDERRKDTFNPHVSLFFSSPLSLSFSFFFARSNFLAFGFQLRSPAGAFLDRHYYNFSEYSIGTGRILACVAQCRM